MEVPPNTPLSRDISGALAWWRDAGVDCTFADAPNVWLSPAAAETPTADIPQSRPMPVIKAPAAPERPRFGGDPATWPHDLAGFHTWWMTEASLDHGSSAQRIAPRGPYGADLLILVEQPEVTDNQRLLSGPQGQMLSAMLAAMGVSEDNAYFASLLTRHTPMPDWQGLQEAGLGDVLRHHLALAAPKRIIAFGSAIPSLLGHAPSQSLLTSVKIGDNNQAIPLFSALSLDALQRAKAKEGLWRRWLNWSGTIAA